MRPTAEICLLCCNLPACMMVPSVYLGYIVICGFCFVAMEQMSLLL